MKVTIKGKTTNFHAESVSKMNIEEFEKFCLGLSTFKQLLPKERDIQIKKAYGELTANAKKITGVKHGSDLHTDDVKSNGRDTVSEQGANDAGEDIEGEEDKAKVRKPKLREEKEETKL